MIVLLGLGMFILCFFLNSILLTDSQSLAGSLHRILLWTAHLVRHGG